MSLVPLDILQLKDVSLLVHGRSLRAILFPNARRAYRGTRAEGCRGGDLRSSEATLTITAALPLSCFCTGAPSKLPVI